LPPACGPARHIAWRSIWCRSGAAGPQRGRQQGGAPAGIELFHGYTYSGHPLAAAAAIATMELHRAEDLPGRALAIEPYWQEAAHSLRSAPNVIDIRDCGLIAGIELAPRAGKPGQRAMEVFRRCFDEGVLIRVTGDIIALSPPLIVEKPQVDRMIGTLETAIRAEAA
jgi:beta-alanine--pyruvate transaminase